MMLMKNERCLIKKIIEINAKMVKICMIFIGLTFLMGFYKETNIYVDLEEITIELGDILPNDEINQISSYLINSNFFLEDNVPKDEDGETTKIGTYNYYIVYRDEERKYSRLTNKRSTITVVDTIKPEIKLKESPLEFEYGSEIKVTDVAECLDLSACKLSFEEKIDTKKEGIQEVTVVAIDEGDNINYKTVNITIKEKPKPVIIRSYSYSGSYSSMNNHNNAINANLTDVEKSSIRNAIVQYAKQFEGNPYVYGGTSLTNGADCSGFTMSVYANFGYRLPRTAGEQGYIGMPVNQSQLLPGDLVVYQYGHTGIYIGNGMMIHAATSEKGIIIAPIFAGNITYIRVVY